MNFIFNAKQPTQDNRDYIFENVRIASYGTNNTCDYRNELLPVRNQGSQGTCYAQTAACVKEWQEKKREYFSPQFIYNNRDYWNNNKQDGEDINEDYGMEGRDVMKILRKRGICEEKLYPYGKIEQVNDIDTSIIANAKKNIIIGYAKITTLQGLKESLMDNGPCLIAFPVYNHSLEMWIKGENDTLLGGHAMTVVGYNNQMEHFVIRNSWGEDWGDKGHTFYKFKDWGSHWECWTTMDDLTNNIVHEDTNLSDNEVEVEVEDSIEESVEDNVEVEETPSERRCVKLLKALLLI